MVKITLGRFFTVISILFWLGVLIFAYWIPIARTQFTIAAMGVGILLYTIYEYDNPVDDDDGDASDTSTSEVIPDESSKLDRTLLIISGVITAVTVVYLFIFYEELVTQRVGFAYTHEYILAAMFTLVIIYLTYRAFGLGFVMVFIGAIVYGFVGPYIPGIFSHGGLSVERQLQILVTDMRGFFGSISQIVATWVALFFLYAGLLRGYGAFGLITQLAMKAASYTRSGIAQSALMASMFIGSINGSATANAAMTGSFTIPLMKRAGMRDDSAAGIESVASSSGQLLPPVMGAAAFVMAGLVVGVQYIDVLIAGILPAIIFVTATAIAIHYTAIGQLDGSKLEMSDETKDVSLFLDGSIFLGSIIVLIFFLGVLQWTVMTSALYTILALIFLGTVVPVVHGVGYDNEPLGPLVRSRLEKTVDGFRQGAIIMAPIAVIVPPINGIVDILGSTGMPGILSLALMDLSGGSLFITVLISMGICILLGLGMPTVAAYTLVALLIAPTLISNFLLPDLAVHFFVLYSAILSGLTPPIAVAVVVASGIAGCNFWRACFEALKIAAPLYLLPISFIYHPMLITDGFTAESLFIALVVLIGAVGIILSTNYPDHLLKKGSGRSNTTILGLRAILGTSGAVVMVYPNMTVKFVLIAVIFVVWLFLIPHHPIRRYLLRQLPGE